MSDIYEPRRDLKSRVIRRLTPYQFQRKVSLPRGKAMVSFTFDDCPISGITDGVSALEQEGWLSTVYVSCGLFDLENHHGKMMNGDDTKALHDSGHEIGDHTYSHVDARELGLELFEEDIDRNQAKLAELGLPPSQNFAYPFGEVAPEVKEAIGNRFESARGIKNTLHRSSIDLNQIGSLPLFGDVVNDAVKAVKSIAKTGGWLTFFTHDVRDNPSNWGCTPRAMKQIIKAVKETDIEVLTIEGAINAIGEMK